MKNTYSFIIFILLLVSCATIPSENAIQTAIAETQLAQPSNTLVPEPSNTLAPGSTTTQTPAPTLTKVVMPTTTISPPIRKTPTEDLSFYDIADCLPKNTVYQKGIVTKIIDGDTIYVRLDDGNTYSVSIQYPSEGVAGCVWE